MGSRLQLHHPHLYARLAGMEPQDRQVAAVAVAEAALRRAQADVPREPEALARVVEGLDAAAWDTQETVDEGQAAPEAYLRTFAKAHAANAMLYCVKERDPYEAVYEAVATEQDVGWVREVLDAL